MRKQIPMFVNITIFTCEIEYIEWLCIFIFGMIYPNAPRPPVPLFSRPKQPQKPYTEDKRVLDHDLGAHRSKKKFRYNDPELFKNMSKSMMSQLKFDHLAMFGPLKWINGSDCQLGAHRNQKMEKIRTS